MSFIIDVLMGIFGEFLVYIIIVIIGLILFGIWLIFKFLWKRIGIWGVALIAYIGILMFSLGSNPTFFVPDAPLGLALHVLGFVLLVIGVIILVVGIIGLGWKHPKWYVKLYAALCGIWEFIVGLVAIVQIDTFIEPMEIIEFSIFFIPPLIPLWYQRRREEEQKRKEAVAWELEDQLKELKEKLDGGIITQEEYEQKKKLLEKSEA